MRFVEISHGNWDQHFNLATALAGNCQAVDQPIAGLLTDLAQRGLLKDTLVVWGGEFGRTPHAQGGDGRDHNNKAFTMWMAGGGVKGGFSLRRDRRLRLRGGAKTRCRSTTCTPPCSRSSGSTTRS